MQCPRCKTERMQATKLEEGLSAMGCGKCGGALVSLLYYRDWVERCDPITDSGEKQAVEDIDETHAAMPCPKCRRLMLKFRISGCSSNRLDLCSSCDEAWLDAGEWEQLKSLELSKAMPQVFTEEWQRRIRTQVMEETRLNRLAQIVGDDDLQQAKDVREWLRNHTNKVDIVHFINHE